MPDGASLVLDFRLLLGLEHAFMESSAIILGNHKGPKVPEDQERINVVLPIFAKKGERVILVILRHSLNIWETLHQVLTPSPVQGPLAEPSGSSWLLLSSLVSFPV